MQTPLTEKQSILVRINHKLLICMIFSFLAASGTLTYGYHFAKYFQFHNSLLPVYLGAIFAFSAVLANVILGTYSLMNIKNKNGHKINYPILSVTTLGAIPYSFICYFGFEDILPTIINIPISIVVIIVNAGIGYTAMQNLWQNLQITFGKSSAKKAVSPLRSMIILLGFLIGLVISVMTFLSAGSGITNILIHYNQTFLVNHNIGFAMAILSWIPCAALFANANQVVVGELYARMTDFKKFLRSINKTNTAIFLFCLCSGTAIAQMTADSFAPSRQIPEFFKADTIQMLVRYLIPLALLSSAALNYFSINKFFDNLKA